MKESLLQNWRKLSNEEVFHRNFAWQKGLTGEGFVANVAYRHLSPTCMRSALQTPLSCFPPILVHLFHVNCLPFVSFDQFKLVASTISATTVAEVCKIEHTAMQSP